MIAALAVCAPVEPESVTCTVKLVWLSVVGVPEIVPSADRVKPSGSAPEAIDHAYGGVPPEAARLCP